MAFMCIQMATVTVEDFDSLLTAWKWHGRQPGSIVGRFVIKNPLTKAQLRKLPKKLKRKLENGCDDSITFLEKLYGLEDPRV
jgi:hypothetical protein